MSDIQKHISNNGMDNSVEGIRKSILNHLKRTQARDENTATEHDWLISTAMAIRDRTLEHMIETMGVHNDNNCRRVYYLSLEFLMGRMLLNYLYNAGLYENFAEALDGLGINIDDLRDEEYDMALGNGGLGRLAACFLDSLATLDYPAVGYGIHYEFGLFKQEFVNGYQREYPDDWIKYGHPWEILRPEYTQEVHIYGEVENIFDDRGNYEARWVNTRTIRGVPYDIPIPGYDTKTVNFLRLWESKGAEDFNLQIFNDGGYVEAMQEKNFGETISKVLYPNDKTELGKELRLVQQYFFCCCSLRDIIRRFQKKNSDWNAFPEKVVIQLNDTHPAIAIPELMRILHDEENMSWDEAWKITNETFAYTNHTLLPEALETWSVPLMQRVLPRHMQIIFEINKRHLKNVEARWPGDVAKLRDLSLIQEGHPQRIRMAHLAVVGSFSVNGVAEMHSRLLKKDLFPLFHEMQPGKLNNKTNGITPRRWLQACNPRLSKLISSKVSKDWVKNLGMLKELEPFADDAEFQKEFMAIKHANKEDLAAEIKAECGIEVDPNSMFDVQIKRLHEYKRQHLKLLHIIHLYRRILQNPGMDVVPRVFIFAAKAAPGYELAKLIIKAINAVGEVVNHDERINGRLKVAFLPNYRVSTAAKIIPAADLSEQISTAGKEASGTGNMKLALNGALTIGTLDGANVEIREEVGDDNIFIFGMTEEEVSELRESGYNPNDYYSANEDLKAAVDWIGSNYFTPKERGVLNPLKTSLLEGGDPFMVLADFEAYLKANEQVDEAWRDKSRWARMAILNTARTGKFSSDRTIHQYAQDIWRLEPMRP
jgi:starch phosphorylase